MNEMIGTVEPSVVKYVVAKMGKDGVRVTIQTP